MRNIRLSRANRSLNDHDLLVPGLASINDASLDWKSLGTAVRERREQLDLTQAAACDQVGGRISRGAWSNIERGRRPSASLRSLKAIEEALGWTLGSASTILEGGEATLITGDAHALDEAVTAGRQMTMTELEALGKAWDELGSVLPIDRTFRSTLRRAERGIISPQGRLLTAQILQHLISHEQRTQTSSNSGRDRESDVRDVD